ncbi:hypothetical protein MsAg5_08380 [Methanosarcinaceae archaeon Ag5]|uniref:Lipoprotein n=1 Tax=Methanolapillus africanus TaxID=3028297 RepID=A0AAE4MI16_9EURY|nr:hypothetical protein [Methanosarcinaceae archaeon Ag5]
MKLKIAFIGFILLISIFAAGCLGGNSNVYDSDKPVKLDETGIKTVKFVSGKPYNVPRGNHIIQCYGPPVNDSYPAFEPKLVAGWSDVIVYATVKEIQPSAWTTPDGTLAINPDDVRTFKETDESGTVRVSQFYDSGSNQIYTYVIFTVDTRVKGSCPNEINLYIPGGQVDNVVMSSGDYPNRWDFREGDQCLLYLKTYSNEWDLVAPHGIRTVIS